MARTKPFYYPLGSSADLLKGKTLILPVVSVANVAQLTVDLLIATLGLKRIGIFDARHLIPFAGAREDGEPGILTALELYGKDGADVVVIQQRSPALKDRKDVFVSSLLKFVDEYKLGGFLLLSGVGLSNRTDSQMHSSTFKLTAPRTSPSPASPFSRIDQLPTYTYASSQSPYSEMRAESETRPAVPFIPGGGLTRRILSTLPAAWSVPTACVLQFVMEGDNRADAHFLAGVLSNLLKLTVSEWKEPQSWREGLFGTPHDQSLYG